MLFLLFHGNISSFFQMLKDGARNYRYDTYIVAVFYR